jgi:hypothetical protein
MVLPGIASVGTSAIKAPYHDAKTRTLLLQIPAAVMSNSRGVSRCAGNLMINRLREAIISAATVVSRM